VTCFRLASLIAFVLWSSPITKLAIKLFPYNAPEEYLLVALKDAETVNYSMFWTKSVNSANGIDGLSFGGLTTR
jgi:hypothetical protein